MDSTQPSQSGFTPQKRGGTQKLMKILLWFLVIFTVATFFICAPMLISGANEDTIIHIPLNATPSQVHDSLARHLGDTYAGRVMQIAKIRKVDWSKRHGAYLISKGNSPFRAMRKLTRGAQEPVHFSINGFRGLKLLIDRIAARFDFSPDSLSRTLADPEVLEPYGLRPDQALCLFFNDSYDAYWSASPKEVVDKIGKYYLDFWTPERNEKLSKLGLSQSEAIIISSIIDEETNAAQEKGRVGRLYVNRLKKGMKLQADPTVRFAIGDFSIKRVRGNHLNFPSPYNTYLNPGLPPGPIRTPSKSTVDSLLDSEETEDLYMCAKEDFSGRHNFATTYEQHLANARRYQEELDRRGIK